MVRSIVRSVCLVLALVALSANYAWAWDAPVAISAAGEGADDASVIFDKKNNAVAVWARSDGSNVRVEAAIRPKDGVFGAAVPISDGGFNASAVRAAADVKGNVIVYWTRSDGSDDRVEVSFRPKDGSFGPAVAISAAGGSAREPRIVFDKKGNALAVWRRFDGVSERIEMAERPKDGTFGVATPISPEGEGAYDPNIAVDKKGNVLVVWTVEVGDKHVVAAFRPRGGSLGPAVQISATGTDVTDPTAAFDGKGNALVVWQRNDGTDRLVEAAFRPKDGSFAAAVPLSTAGQDAYAASLAFDKKGNAVAVWTRSDGTNDRVEVALRPKDGSFSAPVQLSSADHGAYDPQVGFDKKGNGLVVWDLYDEGLDADVMQGANLPKGTTTFGAPFDISGSDYPGFGPQIAFDGRGNAICVWVASDGADYRAWTSFHPKQ